jgi:hypothetical protein
MYSLSRKQANECSLRSTNTNGTRALGNQGFFYAFLEKEWGFAVISQAI